MHPRGFEPARIERPGGSLLSRERHHFNGRPTDSLWLNAVSYSPWTDGLETQTQAYATNGSSLLRQEARVWEQGDAITGWGGWPPGQEPDRNPRVRESTVTLADISPNKVSKTTYLYDKYNNKTEVQEYGYGSGAAGPLLRKTLTTYKTAGYDSNFDIHLRSLPVQESIYTAAGVLASATQFEYDASPLASRAGISEHDPAYGSGLTTRGNVTRIARWLNTSTNAACLFPLSGGCVNEYREYDVAGNVTRIVDARSNSAQFFYDDHFGGPNGEVRSNSAPAELSGEYSYAFVSRWANAAGHLTYTQCDYYLGVAVDHHRPGHEEEKAALRRNLTGCGFDGQSWIGAFRLHYAV